MRDADAKSDVDGTDDIPKVVVDANSNKAAKMLNASNLPLFSVGNSHKQRSNKGI